MKTLIEHLPDYLYHTMRADHREFVGVSDKMGFPAPAYVSGPQ